MPMNAVADVSREPDAQDFETIFRQLSPMVYRTARRCSGVRKKPKTSSRPFFSS